MASPFNTNAARPADCATDAQITRAIAPALDKGLWRSVDPEAFGKYISRAAVLNTMIGWALAPMSDDTPPAISRVINGAVNATAFYKVDRPTEGKWAGFVFVKLMVSDEEQRMSRAAGDAILRKIAAVGAENAAARYGHELGECGMCGRTLTNDESRARGIGPLCAAKAGW